ERERRGREGKPAPPAPGRQDQRQLPRVPLQHPLERGGGEHRLQEPSLGFALAPHQLRADGPALPGRRPELRRPPDQAPLRAHAVGPAVLLPQLPWKGRDGWIEVHLRAGQPMTTVRAALAALLLAAPALRAEPRQSRIDQSKHNFFGPGQRSPVAGMDLCQFCHVPNRLETSPAPPPPWDPRVKGRPAALTERADPAGPPLPLRWAGSTLRCMSCHDSTVSSIAIVYRPASSSLRFDHTAGDVRRREG